MEGVTAKQLLYAAKCQGSSNESIKQWINMIHLYPDFSLYNGSQIYV